VLFSIYRYFRKNKCDKIEERKIYLYKKYLLELKSFYKVIGIHTNQIRGEQMIVVSSCLAGLKVRYNETDCLDESMEKLLNDKKIRTVCPELLGGFSTPREPAEIIGGNGYDVLDGKAVVQDRKGNDVTQMYINGAFKTLEFIKSLNPEMVVLKENSPSCGSSFIYTGCFDGTKKDGVGVTTAILRRNGIKVISENELFQ